MNDRIKEIQDQIDVENKKIDICKENISKLKADRDMLLKSKAIREKEIKANTTILKHLSISLSNEQIELAKTAEKFFIGRGHVLAMYGLRAAFYSLGCESIYDVICLTRGQLTSQRNVTDKGIEKLIEYLDINLTNDIEKRQIKRNNIQSSE